MSNWSKIIVVWTAHEDPLDAPTVKGCAAKIAERVEAIERATDIHHLVTSYPCGADTTNKAWACETVAVFDANHFDDERLIEVLKGLDWEQPEQVQFFWKDENMDDYVYVHPMPAMALEQEPAVLAARYNFDALKEADPLGEADAIE